MDHDFDPDLDGVGKRASVMIWKDGKPREVQLQWGLRPIESGGKAVSLLRSERWEISNPCLMIATEFALKPEDSKLVYAASLITEKPFFCVAGMWRPASSDRPAAFAALTVPAYPDLEPYKDRHVAVVRPEDWWHWLAGRKSKDDVIRPYLPGCFRVTGSTAGPRGRAVADLFA